MHERAEPAMAYLLYRGEYDKRRDSVKPDTPDALPPMPADLPKNRLGLAQWLVRPEHPLTARVMVNRFWQEVFGTGLVRTAGDFGSQRRASLASRATRLACGRLPRIGLGRQAPFRMMVESSTYRQSAATTPEKREKDPHNRLLSRGPRFRMDGEMIRDAALACSGLLVPTLGGPSVKPYQPEGVWEAVAMPESNTHFYEPDHGDQLYRRSLYTFWKRSAPPASLDVFNAPTPRNLHHPPGTNQYAAPGACDAQRSAVCRGGAGSRAKDAQARRPDRRRAHRLYRPAIAGTAVPPRGAVDRPGLACPAECELCSHPDDARHLLSVGESKADPSLDPATLAAWTMLANELMNLDEFLNK